MVGQTPAVKDLLAANTLDRELFCALIAEYIVDESFDYEQKEFSAFPIPYRVIERMIKDLFGEEEEEVFDSSPSE